MCTAECERDRLVRIEFAIQHCAYSFLHGTEMEQVKDYINVNHLTDMFGCSWCSIVRNRIYDWDLFVELYTVDLNCIHYLLMWKSFHALTFYSLFCNIIQTNSWNIRVVFMWNEMYECKEVKKSFNWIQYNSTCAWRVMLLAQSGNCVHRFLVIWPYIECNVDVQEQLNHNSFQD